MLPPPTLLSRFQTTLPTLWEHTEHYPELHQLNPAWAPPAHGKWVEVAVPSRRGYAMIKARWVQDRAEFVKVDNVSVQVLGWKG
jgi:hypothetical protein